MMSSDLPDCANCAHSAGQHDLFGKCCGYTVLGPGVKGGCDCSGFTPIQDNEMKTLGAVTRSAFEAGISLGAGYPAREAIPEDVPQESYTAWWDRWTGRPHEVPEEVACDAGTSLGGMHTVACFSPGGHAHNKPGHYDIDNDTAQQLGAFAHLAVEPAPEPAPEPIILQSLLLLVGDEFPGEMPKLSRILTWGEDTRREVASWAAAIHLSASDNEGIVIPPMPEVLKLPQVLFGPRGDSAIYCPNNRLYSVHTKPCSPGCNYPEPDIATQMGHPGGHYG